MNRAGTCCSSEGVPWFKEVWEHTHKQEIDGGLGGTDSAGPFVSWRRVSCAVAFFPKKKRKEKPDHKDWFNW